MDIDYIVHRVYMIYLNVAVILAAYLIPKKYVEFLGKQYVVDTFQKVYISIIGAVVIFVLSILFATKYEAKNDYLVSQFIIFFLPFFVGLFRAFRKNKK
jgi:putative effector of murein hydrolase LrgA (UPF0299 family)